ncbi:MAG TPA: nucleotidyltransferase family protein, partial [Acidimicrobiales bacterium]|nr:nucleotidyltransferase family protein [Acidimicrobiales bacterium]
MDETRHTELGRLLLRCLTRPGLLPPADLAGLELDEPTIEELTALANHHRVPGVVYAALRAAGLDDDQLLDLRHAYQMATLAHARCLVELAATRAALADAAVPWIVVKGPVLVELGYRDPGSRLYEDLDVVVAPRSLSAAIAALEETGGRVVDLDWRKMSSSRRAEIPMVLGNGLLCDLHWSLLITGDARARFDLSVDELMERRRPVRLGGVDVHTLDVTDGLLYLCLHGSLSGGHQLVWTKDLSEMIMSEPVDWDELVRRARRWRADLVAAVQLERARELLHTDIPDGLVNSLARGRPWWRFWRLRERRAGVA